MGGTVNLTSFALLTAVISLSQFFYFIESHENTIVEFLFCYLNQMGMQKIYLWYSPIHCSSSSPNYDDFRCWETRTCEEGPLVRLVSFSFHLVCKACYSSVCEFAFLFRPKRSWLFLLRDNNFIHGALSDLIAWLSWVNSWLIAHFYLF